MTERGLPFDFDVPVGIWFDKSAPEGKQRRIGGLITTDNKDRQNEVVVQKGLDFSPWLGAGWFNDNHSKDTDGIVGYPDKDALRFVKKGEKLPNGSEAPGNGHWAEGYLLESDRGNRIWDTAQALHKAGNDRRLGFSIEGSIQKRTGPDRKTIAKAQVRNVAITACPVNLDTKMEAFAKSLRAVEQCETPEELWKTLGMGTEGGPLPQPAGPQTGMTAGQVLAPESLEGKRRVKSPKKDEDEEEDSKKSLTPETAMLLAKSRFPGITATQIGRLFELTRLMKAQGQL
jgi:hypothetical protein